MIFRFGRNGGMSFTLTNAGSGAALATRFIADDSSSPGSYTFTPAAPIVGADPVELRLYIYGGGNAFNEAGFGRLSTLDNVNDIIVTGSAVTPEPAAGMLLVGAGLLALRRRRVAR